MAQRKNKLTVVMDVPFATFGKEKRVQFITDLSELAGVPVEEMDEIVFKSGCVICTTRIDQESLSKFVDLYQLHMDEQLDKNSEDSRELIAFLNEYKISEIRSEKKIYIHVCERDNVVSKNKPTIAVFVHGWLGDDDTFGQLPEYLKNACGIEPLLFAYPTHIVKRSPKINYIARNLENFIASNIDLSKKNIALIGHSMGGLIIRDLLSRQKTSKRRIDRAVGQATFCASPLVGAPKANLAKLIPIVSSSQIEDFRTGSPYLLELKSRWHSWKENTPHLEGVLRSIYAVNDEFVPAASAADDDPDAIPDLTSNHRSIVKPNNSSDEIVLTITQLLKEANLV